MYTVTIRDHMMIAHSLPSEAFGPAQKLHGATYVVDAEFRSDTLDSNNIVIDIDIATNVLQGVLAPLKYRNLDDLPELKDRLTTTEFLAKWVHDGICREIKDSFQGSLRVTLGESPVAWASYEGEVS